MSLVVRAADLTLEAFIEPATLAAAPHLPGPRDEIRTVLLGHRAQVVGRADDHTDRQARRL